MEVSKRKLARSDSSRAASTKPYARRKVLRADADGQELLSGIPNHVTMENIASKLDWKTCNVLQMVSKGWRQAIHNRDVYDAKVLSKSTKPFLVVLGFDRQESDYNIVLTLYSCRDRCLLRLPPISPIPQPDYIACVCLEGRVYLWIRERPAKQVQLYVLDLAGHKKWEERKPVNDQLCRNGNDSHGLGILDGKIYTFPATSCVVLTPDDPEPSPIEEKVKRLPRTEMYDPLHNAWSLVTPAPPVSAVVSNVDLEHHSASFPDWTGKKLAADPSRTFLSNGRYESYFSEWKQKQSHEHSTTSTVDNDFGNGMATQVYYSRSPSLSRSEEVLFFGRKLIKYENHVYGFRTGATLDIQGYDAQTNVWEHWKSVSMDFQSLKDKCKVSIYKIYGLVASNNSLWAIVGVRSEKSFGEASPVAYFLVRSLESLGDDTVKFSMWIDTGFQECHGTYFFGHNDALKPIYL